MTRRKDPLENLAPEDKEAKGKVAMVLSILAGERSISEACREMGLQPLSYYRLEERMLRSMLATAKMPARRGRQKDPLAESSELVSETEELRREHRRLQSLMRVTRKLAAGPKRGPGRPRKAVSTPPAPETPHRKAAAAAATES
jgi:hypothetical protein